MNDFDGKVLVVSSSTASALIANQVAKFVCKTFFPKCLPKTLGGLSLWYSSGVVGIMGLFPVSFTLKTKYTYNLTAESERPS